MKKNSLIALFILLTLPAAAEKIKFSADSMSGQAGNSSTTTSMTGNARVQTKSIEIKADSLELSGEDYRNIKAQGNVSGKNLESNMEFSCESLSYDRITKKITLKGNVKLTDIDNKVDCGAQIIEYDQDKNVAIMQIQISLTQKDNVCSGSYAVYYKEQQLLEISGNAQVKQNKDTFRAQFITLDLETQDIKLGGNVKGSVTDTKENKAEKEDKPETEASAAAEDADRNEEAAGQDEGEKKEEDAAAEESSSEKSKKSENKKGSE